MRTYIVEMILIANLASCGLEEPTYIAYEDDGTGAAATGNSTAATGTNTTTNNSAATTCESNALAVFNLQIAAAVSGSCQNCHATNNPLTLVANRHAQNRAALLAFAGTDADTLINKIHQKNGSTHGGGDQSGTLGANPIREWMAAEARCTGG